MFAVLLTLVFTLPTDVSVRALALREAMLLMDLTLSAIVTAEALTGVYRVQNQQNQKLI